jgi:hypothetical protein
MKLSDVLAAAMALTPEDRLKLVDAIAVVDDWRIDIVDKPKTMAEAIAAVKPKATEPANNRKAYTGKEVTELYEIASRMDTDSSFGEKQQRKAITEAAKRLGRTEKAIAEKIRTIRAE